MLSKVAGFLLLILSSPLFAACDLDSPDDAAPVSPAATQVAEPPRTPDVLPSPRVPARSTPGEVPTAEATRAPEPVETPVGTTGFLDREPGEVVLDEACLDQVAGRAQAPGSPRLASPDVTGLDAPEAFSAIPFEVDEALQTRLEAALGGEADEYAFFVKDLATGQGAVHNPGRLFNAASTFKLWVMYEVFRQQAHGLLDWDDTLVVTPYYDAFALSPRVTQLCQALTVAEALDAMMSVSDNAAAVLLQDLVGAPNINASIGALGVTQSGLFTDGLPVTAEDLALLLEAIARGQAVSREASADMLGLMARERIDNGLVGGLPAEAVVAHKTGNWADATHDAGIVYAPFGVYVFVALTDNGYETAIIRALSAAAYEHLEAMVEDRP